MGWLSFCLTTFDALVDLCVQNVIVTQGTFERAILFLGYPRMFLKYTQSRMA